MMGSNPRRENEYDLLNRATIREYSSEQTDTMSAIRHQLMARDLGTQEQTP